ncbi:hypothetical protein BH09SUM1_BH09SUM1_21760 [soil metagenome]
MPESYPMQTRAAFLLPEQMTTPERARRSLDELASRGYNTIIFPAIHEGSSPFRTRGNGSLSKKPCMGRKVLEMLRDYPFSVLLSVDLMAAGPPKGRRLGAIAQENRHWLIKNTQGKYRAQEFPELPGLFCWTTTDFRRFVGNLLVELTGGYPTDGLVFDLRYVPRTTPDPATWTHLGYSSLQHIQHDLHVNLEDFLNQPTVETLNRITNWREDLLLRFMENLKARVQKVRGQTLTAVLASIPSAENPYMPWLKAYDDGTVDDLLLHAPADEAENIMSIVDAGIEEARCFQLAIAKESQMEEYDAVMNRMSATGYCVMKPVYQEETTTLPPASMVWEHHGAVEIHPVDAAAEMIRNLAAGLDQSKRMGQFFLKLLEYFGSAKESIRYEDALKIRKDIVRIQKKIREEESESIADYQEIERTIDLIARLLLLTPVQNFDY